jgi:hypothetical protein
MATSKTRSTTWDIYFRRSLWLFAIAAIVLVPWSVWLSHALPPTHLDRRWGLAWSGLDVGEFLALGTTAYLGYRKSGWIVVSASIAGTLLLLDAWFDTLTATTGTEYLQSLLSATFLELPLSCLAFFVAYKVGKKFL